MVLKSNIIVNYLKVNKKTYFYHRIYKRCNGTSPKSNACERKQYIQEVIQNFNLPMSPFNWRKQFNPKFMPKPNVSLSFSQKNMINDLIKSTSTDIKTTGLNEKNNICNATNLYQVKKEMYVNNLLPEITFRKFDNKENIFNEFKHIEETDREEKDEPSKESKKVNNINGNLTSSEQNSIDTLIENMQEGEASRLVEGFIAKDLVPNFLTLKHLSHWVSKHGNLDKIKLYKNTCMKFYPKLLEENAFFDLYFCKAFCHQGQVKEALFSLNSVIKEFSHLEEVTEVANSLMTLINNFPEELREEAFGICKHLIELENEYDPAVILWKHSIISDQYQLKEFACQLLEDHPSLLDGYDDTLINMVEEAFQNKRTDQLHYLIEIFIKLTLKEPLHQAISSLLSLYCTAENFSAANEVLIFAQQNKIYLRHHCLSQYMNLLNKRKHPASSSFLANFYKFKRLKKL